MFDKSRADPEDATELMENFVDKDLQLKDDGVRSLVMHWDEGKRNDIIKVDIGSSNNVVAHTNEKRPTKFVSGQKPMEISAAVKIALDDALTTNGSLIESKEIESKADESDEYESDLLIVIKAFFHRTKLMHSPLPKIAFARKENVGDQQLAADFARLEILTECETGTSFLHADEAKLIVSRLVERGKAVINDFVAFEAELDSIELILTQLFQCIEQMLQISPSKKYAQYLLNGGVDEIFSSVFELISREISKVISQTHSLLLWLRVLKYLLRSLVALFQSDSNMATTLAPFGRPLLELVGSTIESLYSLHTFFCEQKGADPATDLFAVNLWVNILISNSTIFTSTDLEIIREIVHSSALLFCLFLQNDNMHESFLRVSFFPEKSSKKSLSIFKRSTAETKQRIFSSNFFAVLHLLCLFAVDFLSPVIQRKTLECAFFCFGTMCIGNPKAEEQFCLESFLRLLPLLSRISFRLPLAFHENIFEIGILLLKVIKKWKGSVFGGLHGARELFENMKINVSAKVKAQIARLIS